MSLQDVKNQLYVVASFNYCYQSISFQVQTVTDCTYWPATWPGAQGSGIEIKWKFPSYPQLQSRAQL